MKKNLVLAMAVLMMGSVAMGQTAKKGSKKEKHAKVINATTAPAPIITETVAPVVTSVAPAQEIQTDKKVAETLWISESSHDFGKIPQGKPVTTDFELKATGTDSLKLEMVQAGCGCTTPHWTAGTYAPGQVVKINVGYNAAGEGAFTKPVTITYNGGQQKVINITGTVFSTPATPAPANSGLGKVQQ